MTSRKYSMGLIKMINKEKLLGLGAYCPCPAFTDVGENKPNCDDYNGICKECAKANIDFHIKYILKFQAVYGDCNGGNMPQTEIPMIKKHLCGISQEKCNKELCNKYTMEWLQEDFKDIFNGFKTGDVE